MSVLIRKYMWALNLLTISICALLAAKAVGRGVAAALPEPPPPAAREGQGSALAALASPTRDLGAILDRNIFCSTCTPAPEPSATGGTPGDPSGAGDGQPVKTTLELTLIATLLSDDDHRWSMAAIQDGTTGHTRLYAIGGPIATSGAILSDVLTRRVLLLNNGRQEYLDLMPAAAAAPRVAATQEQPEIIGGVKQPKAADGLEDIAKGIRKVGEGKYEIDRAALNKVLSNTTMLARSARIVPSVKDGKANGFRLYAIRPGSIYSLLGMFNGDNINAVNGHPMNTPDKALEIYTKLRSASNVSISFSRRGSELTHEYTIR